MRYAFNFLLTSVLFSTTALACARGELLINVPPSFNVQVVNGYGPVVGLRIKVTHFRIEEYEKATESGRKLPLENAADGMSDIVDNTPQRHSAVARREAVNIKNYVDVLATAVTDSTGTVHFDLAPADYLSLEADHPDADLGDIILNVSKDSRFQGPLKLGWPGTFLEAKSVSGTIEDGSMRSKGNPLKQSLAISVTQSDCGLAYDLVENKIRYRPVYCVKGSGQEVPCDY